jgi:hypothetical protein
MTIFGRKPPVRVKVPFIQIRLVQVKVAAAAAGKFDVIDIRVEFLPPVDPISPEWPDGRPQKLQRLPAVHLRGAAVVYLDQQLALV